MIMKCTWESFKKKETSTIRCSRGQLSTEFPVPSVLASNIYGGYSIVEAMFTTVVSSPIILFFFLFVC